MKSIIKTNFKSERKIYADELVSLIENEDFENFKYVRNMSDRIGAILEISNFNLSVYEHTNVQILDVFKDTIEFEFKREIVMTDSNFNSNDKSGTDISKENKRCEFMVIDAIPRIYKVLNNPTKQSGIYYCQSLRKKVFNIFKEPENRKTYLNYAGILNSESIVDEGVDSIFKHINLADIGLEKSFEEHFKWSSYKTWEILLKNLTNPNKNKCFYQTGKMEEVCPFEHVVKWLHIVATTNKKTGILPIFVSATPGAGKGILQKIFFDWLFSKDYSVQITSKTLSGGFNSIIKDKLFWIFDEGQVAKAEQTKVAGTLKNLITEENMVSENKGKDQEMVENYSNGMIATNVFAIPLDTDDRRCFVLETHHKSLEERVVYEYNYNSISDFIDQLILERDSFMKDLFTFDFNFKDVLAKPIMSEAKKKMVYATNTMTSNVISIIRRRDINELRSFFAGEIEGINEIKLAKLCEEIKMGFLTNESTSFIYDMLRNERDKGMSKKLYWDKHFETIVTRKFDKYDGSKSSKQIRIINQDYFNKAEFEKYMMIESMTDQEKEEQKNKEINTNNF